MGILALDEAEMQCERHLLTYKSEGSHGSEGPIVVSHRLDVRLGFGTVRLRHEGCLSAVKYIKTTLHTWRGN